MDNNRLENEIEMRMNPEDLSINSTDLHDIMNLFGVSEQEVAELYSKLIYNKRKEINNTIDDVIDYFKSKGDYKPSFEKFKSLFDDYRVNYINDNILRDMYKNKIEDKNNMSLYEIQKFIKEEVIKLNERDRRFDDEYDEDFESARAEKNWGGAGEPDEEFDAEEFFGAAGDAAEDDIRAEFGDDEFTPFGTMEDPRMLKNLEEDGLSKKGLFKPQDAEGNDINLKTLVKHIGSEKKGRVVRLGDDGSGSLIVVVDWAWPTDMKFTDPEEMGEKREAPEHLVVQGINEGDGEYGRDKLRGVKVTYGDGSIIKTSMAAHLTDDEIYNYFKKGTLFNIGSVEDNMQPVADVEIFRENLNTNTMNEELNEEEINEEIADTDASEGDAEETIEEMRGLGSGVKNSGDRNVKQRDDHAHAPLTNLNESLNKSIKNLMEGKVTKKALKEFIAEEAKKVAKNLKG